MIRGSGMFLISLIAFNFAPNISLMAYLFLIMGLLLRKVGIQPIINLFLAVLEST
jgi:hypothetical protein